MKLYVSDGRCTLVIVNDALFNFESPEAPAADESVLELGIQDQQVAAIREAFASAGIDSQDRRKEIVQSCVVRPIGGLRDLTAAEAHRILKRIEEVAAAKPRPAGASSWDLREEDTWIDRL